jgi:hypothetical protein
LVPQRVDGPNPSIDVSGHDQQIADWPGPGFQFVCGVPRGTNTAAPVDSLDYARANLDASRAFQTYQASSSAPSGDHEGVVHRTKTVAGEQGGKNRRAHRISVDHMEQ